MDSNFGDKALQVEQQVKSPSRRGHKSGDFFKRRSGIFGRGTHKFRRFGDQPHFSLMLEPFALNGEQVIVAVIDEEKLSRST